MSANVEVVSKAKVNLKVTTVAGAGGGGTSDHGALTGLGDDDLATPAIAVNTIPRLLAASPGLHTMRSLALPSFAGGK